MIPVPPLPAPFKLPPIRHVGIVVTDLAAAMAHYPPCWGLGPWFKARFNHGDNFLHGTERINTEYALASAFSGPLEIQLIQVVGGDRDALTDHLERHGAGVHHVGVYVKNMARCVDLYKEQGITVLQSGVLQSPGSRWGTVTRYAYLDTTAVGGMVLELLQIDVLGINIGSSRFWFELGTWLGQMGKWG